MTVWPTGGIWEHAPLPRKIFRLDPLIAIWDKLSKQHFDNTFFCSVIANIDGTTIITILNLGRENYRLPPSGVVKCRIYFLSWGRRVGRLYQVVDDLTCEIFRLYKCVQNEE